MFLGEWSEGLALIENYHFVEGYLEEDQILDVYMHAFGLDASEGPLHLVEVDLVNAGCLQNHTLS